MEQDRRYYARTPYKIVVVGDPAVGKTTLIQKYTKKIYRDEYLPTLGVEITSKEIDVETPDGIDHINLIFWDLSGQQQFSRVRTIFYSGIKAIIYMYDISNPKSFQNIDYWVDEAKRNNQKEIESLLIGNKIDISDNRKILNSAGSIKSDKLKVSFFEISCKTHQGVNNMFNFLIKSLIKKNIIKLELLNTNQL